MNWKYCVLSTTFRKLNFLWLYALLSESSGYFRLLSSRSYFVISLSRAGIVNLSMVAASRGFAGKCLELSVSSSAETLLVGMWQWCCSLHMSPSNVMFSGDVAFIQVHFNRQLITVIYYTLILMSDGFQGGTEPSVGMYFQARSYDISRPPNSW